MTKSLILGGGRTGRAAYNFLKSRGEKVCVWDDDASTRVSFGEDAFVSFEGISRVILSPGLPILWPYAHFMYKEAQRMQLPIISDIDLLYSHAKKAQYIGITGTNGKSTTTALLGHCLEAKEHVAVGGNLGTAALTFPLFKEEGTYVLEMSSYQLEASKLVEFDIAVLLNISPDHLDRHGGMSGYVHAKQLIFKGMPEDATTRGIVGVDTPQTREVYEYLEPLMGDRLIPISVERFLSFGYCLKDDFIYRNGQSLWDMNEHKLLKGTHNAQNVMAVWAILCEQGFKDHDIQERIMSFKGLAHRQEYVLETDQGIVFINDSKATNAQATIQALKAYERVYLILGGRAKLGGIESLVPYFDRITHVLLIGEAAEAFSLCLQTHGVSFSITKTLEHSLSFDFPPSTIVLLSPACASFDQFNSFEERGDIFKRLVLERFKRV